MAPRRVNGRRVYPLLLALETAGAVTILWHGVPLYRSLLSEPALERVDMTVIAWAATGIILIQAPYWVSTLKVFQSVSTSRHVLAGHAILFLARLNFVFVSGLFAVVVFVRAGDLEFVLWRALMLVAVLFSMFCFTLELERLGKMLMQGHSNPNEQAVV